MKPLGDRQVVGRAKRLGAEIAEPETRDAAGGLRNLDRVAFHREHHRIALRAAGEAAERAV